MTRETKIGLLVGLAFIIVIGILLSDHLTSSTDPPPAVLTQAGSSVRSTTVTPGGSQPPPQPVVVAPQVSPYQQVPTQGDLDARQRAQEVIKIGVSGPTNTAAPQPPGQATISNILIPQSRPQAQAQSEPPIVHIPQQPPSNPGTNTQQVNPTLEQVAEQHGETLITLGQGGSGRPTQPIRVDSTPSGMVEYTAQPGDNLSRMANKLLGANTKANRDAIVKANASLQANPDKVVVGKSYRIPSAGSVAAATSGQPAPSAAPIIAAQQNNGEFWYTVKEGDNLTRIAREQLGLTEAAIPALIELNRDTIKDPNSLQINSRIRLPGRPVAQIN